MQEILHKSENKNANKNSIFCSIFVIFFIFWPLELRKYHGESVFKPDFYLLTYFYLFLDKNNSGEFKEISSTSFYSYLLNVVIISKIVNKSIKNSKITKLSCSSVSDNKKQQLYVQYFNMAANMAAKSIYRTLECWYLQFSLVKTVVITWLAY